MSLNNIARLLQTLPDPDDTAAEQARRREASLTKPAGALGRLEHLSEWCAAWQGRHPPTVESVDIVVFAGNHGVVHHGVSAYPPEVTSQMVANFRSGGGAINQLATLYGARLRVVEFRLDQPTRDLTVGPAMSEDECAAAFRAGFEAVPEECDLLIPGEMGIGNTTAAAALACALIGGTAADWTGPGTGLDPAGVALKTRIVDAAIDHHRNDMDHPLEALRRLGGREIAALAGAILAARKNRIPVILDGFVATAGAAVLEKSKPGALDHCIAGHVSAEPGHRRLLRTLRKRPLLDLGMRLGEGSGAVMALGVLKAAVATHRGMATFEDAMVSRRSGSDS